MYANSKNPVYLRVLNRESITAKSSLNYETYLKQFGYWRAIKLKNFENVYGTTKSIAPELVYPFKERVYRFLQQLNVNLRYNYFLFKK